MYKRKYKRRGEYDVDASVFEDDLTNCQGLQHSSDHWVDIQGQGSTSVTFRSSFLLSRTYSHATVLVLS